MDVENGKVDWTELAQRLGTLDTHGSERCTSDDVQLAIVELISEDVLRDAVVCYVESRPGAELARGVLKMLRPRFAIDHCVAIIDFAPEFERRRNAAELFRVIASVEDLSVVTRMLGDESLEIAISAIQTVDNLLINGFATAHQCVDQITSALRHPDVNVRNKAKFVVRYLRDNDEWPVDL